MLLLQHSIPVVLIEASSLCLSVFVDDAMCLRQSGVYSCLVLAGKTSRKLSQPDLEEWFLTVAHGKPFTSQTRTLSLHLNGVFLC